MRGCFWLVGFTLLAACSGSSADPDWMTELDDSFTLAELSLPGSHDSAARFEPYPGIARTQTLTIAEQLDAGIRYLDVRCRHFEDQFLIYHGAVDQNQTFDEVLATMNDFHDAHPGEVIVVSIKEEAVPAGNTRSFEDTFGAYVAQDPAHWVLAPTVPRLGDVRGKLVLLRRFDATTVPLGIDATQWPDNTVFTIDDVDARLRIEDLYNLTDNATKWSAITGLLAEAAAGDPATWMLTYTSGFQTMQGLPNIPSVSDDINARLDTLLGKPATAHAHLGTVVMDFVTAARVGAIVATNRAR